MSDVQKTIIKHLEDVNKTIGIEVYKKISNFKDISNAIEAIGDNLPKATSKESLQNLQQTELKYLSINDSISRISDELSCLLLAYYKKSISM